MANQVRDVMTVGVRCVGPQMKLQELEEVLLRDRISAAPVSDDGRVVGLVSRSDIVKHLQVEQSQAEAISTFYLDPYDAEEVTPADLERVAEAVASHWQNATVADVMTRGLIRVGPDEPLGSVARLMLERRVHRVLVMDGDALVGIVASLDLIRLFAEGRVVAA